MLRCVWQASRFLGNASRKYWKFRFVICAYATAAGAASDAESLFFVVLTDCLRAPQAVSDVRSRTSSRNTGAGIWRRIHGDDYCSVYQGPYVVLCLGDLEVTLFDDMKLGQ